MSFLSLEKDSYWLLWQNPVYRSLTFLSQCRFESCRIAGAHTRNPDRFKFVSATTTCMTTNWENGTKHQLDYHKYGLQGWRCYIRSANLSSFTWGGRQGHMQQQFGPINRQRTLPSSRQRAIKLRQTVTETSLVWTAKTHVVSWQRRQIPQSESDSNQQEPNRSTVTSSPQTNKLKLASHGLGWLDQGDEARLACNHYIMVSLLARSVTTYMRLKTSESKLSRLNRYFQSPPTMTWQERTVVSNEFMAYSTTESTAIAAYWLKYQCTNQDMPAIHALKHLLPSWKSNFSALYSEHSNHPVSRGERCGLLGFQWQNTHTLPFIKLLEII